MAFQENPVYSPSGICGDLNQCHGPRRNPTEANRSCKLLDHIGFIDFVEKERRKQMNKTAAKETMRRSRCLENPEFRK